MALAVLLLALTWTWKGRGPAPAAPSQAAPKRVVSMSPNLTEIVYDIGGEDQLVAVTDFCKFPPEARQKTKVGGFQNPNIERIVSLKPDLVLLLPFHGEKILKFRQLDVPTLVLNNQTLSDILGSYDALGRALGREAQAAAAKGRLAGRLEAIRKKAGKKRRVSALFVVGMNPGTLQQIYAAGPGTFVHELLETAGGDNILHDAMIPYPILSKEELVRRDPEVIFQSVPISESAPGAEAGYLKAWAQLHTLQAVKNGRIYFVTRDEFLIPGPTMAGLAEYLSGILQEEF